jgi:hypothetical protein
MTDGILDVKLVPRWAPSSVRWDLMAALARARYLQAGIGYWTIADSLLGPDLVRALRDDHGFVCVDLHLPTDVDALAALTEQGAQVRVYHEDIRTFGANGRKEPPHLLHTKMLLFGSADHTAELWVGSHNWTNRALLGLNVEASLVIRLRDSAPLFRGATAYLAEIRKISAPFDVAQLDFYREVQRRSVPTACPVMELAAEDAGGLAGATVTIFGTDTTDLAPLDAMRAVHVALVDRATGTEHVYTAVILHAGLLAASDAAAGGLSFSPRRSVFRRGRGAASIGPERSVEQAVLDAAQYFVTLRLGNRERDLMTDAPRPPEVRMHVVPSEDSVLLSRLDEDALARLFRGRAPRVERAVAVPGGATLDGAPRTTASDAPLVAMRVLRRV